MAQRYRLLASNTIAVGSGAQLLVRAAKTVTGENDMIDLSNVLDRLLDLVQHLEEAGKGRGAAAAEAHQLLRLLTSTVTKPEKLVGLLEAVCTLAELALQQGKQWTACGLVSHLLARATSAR